MDALIKVEPDIQQKLAILGAEAAEEQTDAPATQSIQRGIRHETGFIYGAQKTGGGTARLFKVLQTNACRFSCPYCFTSCAIKRQRTTFKPDELATTFISLSQQRRVDGLFLSSGIVPDADTTMEKMLGTVERLRLKEGYAGYIHLKLIPGASRDLIARAVELADRVSLNLEAPSQARLSELAPDKEFAGDMWGRMAWAAELIRRARAEGRPAARSLTTQFVVGAAGESDCELLETVQRAHRELGLWRAYFSAFKPIDRSPFSDQPAEDPARALRLYQSDFMLRDYGFRYDELPFDADGLLPRDRTPKQVWAERNLHDPVELNRASRSALLRVPGIGPKSADKIIAARREARLRDMSQLKALGVTTSWAAPYVLLDGRASAVQLRLW
ncbi:radical SAM protein [Oscillochloris sp. ZM17-4]|uniref:radical SAM protein n=1 Tax=Oscillochloris sp. ZM17-4 TaxID=2866714 RepID=UPI001C73DC80|nr:radical SAM protein [Oscillochloris sp. ZM17-4]MBX0330256.1 radical SAM protein [Oscillochloris sp. ZM17-4]